MHSILMAPKKNDGNLSKKSDVKKAFSGRRKTFLILLSLTFLDHITLAIQEDKGAVIIYGWGVDANPKIACTQIPP